MKGIWSGMISGVFLQTLILAAITIFTNWKQEVELSLSLFLSHSISLLSPFSLPLIISCTFAGGNGRPSDKEVGRIHGKGKRHRNSCLDSHEQAFVFRFSCLGLSLTNE